MFRFSFHKKRFCKKAVGVLSLAFFLLTAMVPNVPLRAQEVDSTLPVFMEPVVEIEGEKVTITVEVKNATADIVANAYIASEGTNITVKAWPNFTMNHNEPFEFVWDHTGITDTKFLFRIDGWAEDGRRINHAYKHFEFPYEQPFPYFTEPVFSQKGNIFSFTFTAKNIPDYINVDARMIIQPPQSVVFQWNPIAMKNNETKTLTWKSPSLDGSRYKFILTGKTPNNIFLADKAVHFIAQEEIDSGDILPKGNCADFTDVLASSADCAAIAWVKEKGIMTGYDNGKFGPNDVYNRAQNVVANLRAAGSYSGSEDVCEGVNPFPDVREMDLVWAYQSICKAKVGGMVEGYASGPYKGLFRPGQSVTMEEALAMSLRVLVDEQSIPDIQSVSYSGVAAGQWYSGYAKYAYDHDLFEENGFYPGRTMTRKEVAKLFYKLGQAGVL